MRGIPNFTMYFQSTARTTVIFDAIMPSGFITYYRGIAAKIPFL